MVTIEIVIYSTRVMGTRVTISCRYYIAFEVIICFCFLVGYFSGFVCGVHAKPTYHHEGLVTVNLQVAVWRMIL